MGSFGEDRTIEIRKYMDDNHLTVQMFCQKFELRFPTVNRWRVGGRISPIFVKHLIQRGILKPRKEEK